jgi:rod shape-determining protein MreD
MNNEHNCVRIFVTLIIAMCLRIVPLPESLALLNPDWVLLVLIYWSLAIPERVGISYAWFFGIFTVVFADYLHGANLASTIAAISPSSTKRVCVWLFVDFTVVAILV